MILGIDAINIKSNGGIVYLKELIFYLNKKKINKIIIFANSKILFNTKNKKIIFVKKKIFEKNFFWTNIWKFFYLSKELKEFKCNKLLSMNGHYFGNFKPTVLIIQNFLPFSKEGRKTFSYYNRFKFFLQKLSHIMSFKKTKNIIFVSKSIKKEVLKSLSFKINNIVCYHGANKKIAQKKIFNRQIDEIFKLIYVSQYNFHKNHLNLFKAIKEINRKKMRVKLDCYGELINKNFNKITKGIKFSKKDGINVYKSIKQESLFKIYKNYDCHIFPSFCESFGLPLAESARAGLLLACSDLNIFKELFKNIPIYFEPNSSESIKRAIIAMIAISNKKQKERIKKGVIMSRKYSWKKETKKIENYILKV